MSNKSLKKTKSSKIPKICQEGEILTCDPVINDTPYSGCTKFTTVSDFNNDNVYIEKYFKNPISSIISLSKKNKSFYINIIVHINKKMDFTAQSNGETAKIALNNTVEKLSKQLRRYKRKIKSHKNYETQIIQKNPATAWQYCRWAARNRGLMPHLRQFQ